MFIVSLFIVYFSGNSHCQIDKILRKEPTVIIEGYQVERRKTVRDLWIKSAEKFAQRAGDSDQTLKILQFVKNNSVLCLPHLDGIISIEGPRKCCNMWIRFFPVIEDADKNTILGKGYLTGLFRKSFGTYQPDYKTIILTDYNGLTEMSRGLIFFYTGIKPWSIS